ncbi:MAG: DsbA family protein, partial [Candidatus Woesearchaeota archaeon]
MEKETLRLVMQGGIAIGILVLVVVVVSLLESRDPLLSEGRILGSPDATKSIIMWSDFTCPYCMEFARSQLPDLYRSYIQTGKAHLVFKHFPAGPDSEIRHLAAECANDQNKFWELHEELYILENKEEIQNSARRH